MENKEIIMEKCTIIMEISIIMEICAINFLNFNWIKRNYGPSFLIMEAHFVTFDRIKRNYGALSLIMAHFPQLTP